LDPSKLKKYWSEEEDFALVDFVRRRGKKWAAISKKLENKRNEHSIKNRYKSLLTRESKQIMRPFD
jgi:ppGpp synthetase/RelA/SpoT-type nucleotidyltranferase